MICVNKQKFNSILKTSSWQPQRHKQVERFVRSLLTGQNGNPEFEFVRSSHLAGIYHIAWNVSRLLHHPLQIRAECIRNTVYEAS